MRDVDVKEITRHIRDMCIEANLYLEDDVEKALKKARSTETSETGKSVLAQLEENLNVAGEEKIPICQDTGMAVVFLEIGQDVHLTGGDITDAVNEGVRQGYVAGYLRKSVVTDPLERTNTGDNTPAVIHFEIVPGDKIKITVAPKGFGSENMSRIFMLKPADGIEGVKDAVISTAKEAGPNACPPFVIGVGIGGDFEKCALMAKKALTRSICREDINQKDTDRPGSEKPGYIEELEKELLEKINDTGLGPAGLGGKNTALAVNIETFPTHIAGLPVAVNVCCHVNRHKMVII